ncbi:outer membrane lipoprotein carrier protein LolA [Flavobacterium sp. NRK1]|uniref:outer membrane lipoprotein carrier protein LolA n=1 Tax=Flavobacterium sp. NRK1 TaxID=2954929 RepID=UPI00209310C1|nr:outer membrane lipoprotein carrier protein LolA [Flavobacterium sp. NRK1]MCO6147280.1 outer membrane lipoprotein carrier protein LolA [Flavobacterium sp. NRK1]
MKNSFFYVFLLIAGMLRLNAQEQKMSTAEITSFKNAVNATAKNTKTLTTDFVQYKHMDFLSKDIETSGKMSFKSPGKLLWQYTKPYQYSVVFKNNTIAINDAGKKSEMNVGNSKMFGKLNKLIVGSVSGDMFDENEFIINYYKSGEHNITKLIPKDAALKKYIKQMELYFDKKANMVSQVKMIEPSNDYTTIVFKNKVTNAQLADSVFNN